MYCLKYGFKVFKARICFNKEKILCSMIMIHLNREHNLLDALH